MGSGSYGGFVIDISGSYSTHQQVSTMVVDGPECFVACKSTRFVAIDVSSGEKRWSVGIQDPWGWLAGTDQVVLCLTQHSLLVARPVYWGADLVAWP